MTLVVTVISFGILALSAGHIGRFFARVNLPLISGYLFAGILIGPFMLGLISIDETDTLRFVDELSLGFIAFAAGSELYLKEIRSRLRSIAWHTVGQLVAVYILGSVTVFMLADAVPFMREMSVGGRIAVAMIVGSILVALSPSSTIAIINELRARGPFTKTVLGVTIVLDVVVIVFFAINTSIADVILLANGFDIGFVLVLAVELLLSLGAGLLLGRLLGVILALHLDTRFKAGLVLLIGFLVFVISAAVRDYTHNTLHFEILLEPLLICMIGSFMITNYSEYRDEFLKIVHDTGPIIYVIFFTLIGSSLQLDNLMATLPIALAIFTLRLVGLFVGSMIGGMVVHDPPHHNRLAWMTYITQAGIGLGLAKEAALRFPHLGDEFATLIVSAIVVSQIVGPPFLKFAIRRVGEAHESAESEPDAVRDTVILGIEGQSRALARQLNNHHWKVIMADTDQHNVDNCNEPGIDVYHIPELDMESLSRVVTASTDAMVLMFHEDDLNLKACELVYEGFGIPRVVVRVNDLALSDQFRSLGATVVYPASAVVSLLDQFVRAPQSAAWLLHRDPEQELTQITITDEDIDGLALRDLRIPLTVLVLGIMRDGHSIVPHGYTILRLHDEVTLIGDPQSLDELTLRLGY